MSDRQATVIEMAVDIVSSYVLKSALPAADLPGLIASVHAAVERAVNGEPEAAPAEPLKPAVPIKKSITEEYIVCLEDGKRFKSLKRHLHSAYGMTPQDYREKWGLPSDYPMVAPVYAAARSELAKTLGLGRKSAEPEVAAKPASIEELQAALAPVISTQPPKAKRGRKAAEANGAAGHA